MLNEAIVRFLIFSLKLIQILTFYPQMLNATYAMSLYCSSASPVVVVGSLTHSLTHSSNAGYGIWMKHRMKHRIFVYEHNVVRERTSIIALRETKKANIRPVTVKDTKKKGLFLCLVKAPIVQGHLMAFKEEGRGKTTAKEKEV